VDWDEDGKKDLITGGSDGLIRIYININTDADPKFEGYTYLQKGGSNFDAGSYVCPYIIDWNKDGKKDVIIGEGNGKIWLLVNEGTNAAPVFNTATYVQDGGSDLDAGTRVSPVATDWDGDGRIDLLVGEYQGYVYYFKNVSLGPLPEFNGSVLLEAGGSIIDVHYYARLDVADWDNDGVLDLLSGNRYYDGTPTGGIWYFHAQGPLSVDKNEISQSTGGTINYLLKAGSELAGRPYFLLASASGTEPGIDLPGGGNLPLNNDFVFQFVLNNYYYPMFTNFRSTLDGQGHGTASLSMNSFPLPPGTILHFAYTTLAPFDYQSNPVPVEVVP
jgi:hypothetical protein